MVWPVADAKARFSELLDATLKDGPQIITRRGQETVAVVSINEWKRLRSANRLVLVDPLTDPDGPHDIYIPPRGKFSLRQIDLND